MSAVSMLKKRVLPSADAHINEFGALEDLDREARSVKTASSGLHPMLNHYTHKGPHVVWTTWKNGSELALIRDSFFPQHAIKDLHSPPAQDFRRRAVVTVNGWKARNCDLEFPHSVPATSSLANATPHDTHPTEERTQYISDQALQSIYAMAFCRFVNDFVDRDVSKASLTALAPTTTTNEDGTTTSGSYGESSMYALASKIGLPSRFVEARHQITHEEMPEIEELREFAGEVLKWTYRRWWRIYAGFDPADAWARWRRIEHETAMSAEEVEDSMRDGEVDMVTSQFPIRVGAMKGSKEQDLASRSMGHVSHPRAESLLVIFRAKV